MMPFWALNSFGQSADVSGLLNKSDTRTEIFNTILNSHELMMEFMNAMEKNDHAMMMINENDQIMMQQDRNMKSGEEEKNHDHQMMGHSNTREGMMGNSGMMQNMKIMRDMMDSCDQDSIMCNEIADLMSEHPHMMQKSIQKMKEHGMMDSNGKMKMMDSDIPMESSTQHGHQ